MHPRPRLGIRRPGPLASLASLASLVAACAAPPPPAEPPPPPPKLQLAAGEVKVGDFPEAREDATLPPRQVFFGDPARARPKLSPDGKLVAFLAPAAGAQNVFVAPVDEPDKARPLTAETERGVDDFFFAYTGEHLLYLKDEGENEEYHLHAVELRTGARRNLTPLPGVNVKVYGLSPKLKGEILVGLNLRDRASYDLYKIGIRTGYRKLVLKNNRNFTGYIADEVLRPRLALRNLPGGDVEVHFTKKGALMPAFRIPAEDAQTTRPIALERGGKALVAFESRDRDKVAIARINTKTWVSEELAEDARSDFSEVLLHPFDRRLQAASTTYDRKRWKIFDPTIEADLQALRAAAGGELEILGRSLDDRRWLAGYSADDAPARYYLYDRETKKTRRLFVERPSLEGAKLAKMRPIALKARDGLELLSYLSLPPDVDDDGFGTPKEPLPLVLVVHDGPWARDTWGFDPTHQWLTSRGYAVMSVNFRGSTGFGKVFKNAGDREWAGKMHDDLVDAVRWAVDRKIAAPSRVAIMGRGYGGYAALVGLTKTPELFACGASLSGPTNLVSLLENVPASRKEEMPFLIRRVGDVRTDHGRAFLRSRSPGAVTAEVRRPLLLAQGSRDPHVDARESGRMVAALRERGIPVTHLVYPDEGSKLARTPNRLSFYAVTEAFLARCLGGAYAPIGRDFEGASLDVPLGAEQIEGVREALLGR